MNIEAHINTHNNSGAQVSGDKDLDGDGQVESQAKVTLKPFHLVAMMFVRVQLVSAPVRLFAVQPIVYSLILLTQQDDPNLCFRPPIAA